MVLPIFMIFFRVIHPLYNLFWLRKGEFNCSMIMQLVFDATVGQIPKYMSSFIYCNKCEMMNERQVKRKRRSVHIVTRTEEVKEEQ